MRLELKTADFRSTSRIDANGLVRGVSVITAGVEAKGHGIFVDVETLETARRVAASFPGGVKVKLDHSDGVDRIVGSISNFRIDGAQLRGDLQLLARHPARAFLQELIEKQPATFGLSISFSYLPKKIDNKTFIRVEDLYSIDLVDLPAANPGGLFGAKPDSAAAGETRPLTGIERTRAAIAQQIKAAPARAKARFERERAERIQRQANLRSADDRPVTGLARVRRAIAKQFTKGSQ